MALITRSGVIWQFYECFMLRKAFNGLQRPSKVSKMKKVEFSKHGEIQFLGTEFTRKNGRFFMALITRSGVIWQFLKRFGYFLLWS